MSFLTQVKINGVDVSSALMTPDGYVYEREFGQSRVSEVVCQFIKPVLDPLLTAENGHTLEIWRGWTTATDEKIFSGWVRGIGNNGVITEILGRDKLSKAQDNQIVYSYDADVDSSAGKISEIWKDIMTTYAGLTADGTTVQDSGTVIKIAKFRCDHVPCWDPAKRLAEALDWQQYYKASDDMVYFEPKGYSNNSTVLETGVNIFEIPEWKEDPEMVIKELTITGAIQEVETTELFNGDASTKDFTLTKKPISVKVYISSVLKTGGKPTATASYDYEVLQERKIIRFQTAPASATDNVEVRFSYAIPTPVIGENTIPTGKTYGKGITIARPDITDVADAEVLLQKVLETYSSPFKTVKCKVSTAANNSIAVGQQIRIDDNINNKDEWLLITKYTIRYPGEYDEITLGDKEIRVEDWLNDQAQRIKRLEEEMTKNQDYLLHIVNLSVYGTARVKSLTVKKRGIGNMYLLGAGDNARLGVVDSGTQPIFGGTNDAWTTEYTKTY